MVQRLPMFSVIASLVAATVSGGCASSPKGEPFHAATVGPDRAVIYVFRLSGECKTPTQIFINQEPAGEVGSGQYLSRVVAPGEYLVRVEAKSSMVREVKVIAGDEAYLMVVMDRKDRPVLQVPDFDVARRLITRTRSVAPEPGASSGSAPSSPNQTAVR